MKTLSQYIFENAAKFTLADIKKLYTEWDCQPQGSCNPIVVFLDNIENKYDEFNSDYFVGLFKKDKKTQTKIVDYDGHRTLLISFPPLGVIDTLIDTLKFLPSFNDDFHTEEDAERVTKQIENDIDGFVKEINLDKE